jgi:hypothetical protein
MSSSHEDPWYSARRARWQPPAVRLLLIAESAPDPLRSGRRYFYDDALTRYDGLFREVVKVLFEIDGLDSGPTAKVPWLHGLHRAGVHLVDLSTVPVNALGAQREAALISEVPSCVARARDLKPDGVVLVKANVFDLLADPVCEAGLHLLHEQPIPFPGSGHQRAFRDKFRQALERLEPPLHLPLVAVNSAEA